MVAGSAGCTSAHYIQKGPDSGVVAIPDNSDVWPTHYKTAALELIKAHIGKDYVILDERVVTTGGRPDANPMAPPPNAPPSTTEYRITYAKRPPQSSLPPGAPIGPGGMPMGVRPISGPPGAGGPPIVTQTGGTQYSPNPNAYSPGALTGANQPLVPGVGPGMPLSPASPMSPAGSQSPYQYAPSSPLGR